MIIQLNGKIVKKDSQLIYINPKKNTAFEITGNDRDLFLMLIPYLGNRVDIDFLGSLIGITNEQLNQILSQLVENNIIKVVEEDKLPRLLIISNNFLSFLDKSFQDFDYTSRVIFSKYKSDIEFDSFDYICAIDNEANYDFYNKIDQISRKVNIPWIKSSIDFNDIYVGPMFFPDGGPCFNCYQSKIMINSDNNNITILKPFENKIRIAIEFLKNELIKLFRVDESFSVLANRELKFNFDEYKIETKRVLKLPNCKYCN